MGARRARVAGWDEASRRAIEYASKAGNHREEIEVLAGLSITAVSGPLPTDQGIRRCREILHKVKGNFRAEAFVLEHLRAPAGHGGPLPGGSGNNQPVG